MVRIQESCTSGVYFPTRNSSVVFINILQAVNRHSVSDRSLEMSAHCAHVAKISMSMVWRSDRAGSEYDHIIHHIIRLM